MNRLIWLWKRERERERERERDRQRERDAVAYSSGGAKGTNPLEFSFFHGAKSTIEMLISESLQSHILYSDKFLCLWREKGRNGDCKRKLDKSETEKLE